MKFLFCVALQIVLFIPFFIIWKNDCRIFGKDNLAAPLKERFAMWIIFFPIWIIPFLKN